MILGAIVASVLPALVGVLGLSVFDPVGFAVRSALPLLCGALVCAGLAARYPSGEPEGKTRPYAVEARSEGVPERSHEGSWLVARSEIDSRPMRAHGGRNG